MGITNEGWLDWAQRIDGIPDKVYSEPNSGEWITCHSVVGEESEFEDGIPNRFLSHDSYYDPDLGMYRYTRYAAASSMFVLRKSGLLIQMYPIMASTWTSGGREANTRSWAIEAEGGLKPNYREPLTPEAEKTFVRLVEEWEAYSGRKAVPGVTLLQHKDVAQRFGYAATACASDRYRYAWVRIANREEEEDMSKLDDLAAIVIGNGMDAICRPGTEDLFPDGTEVVPYGQLGPTYRLTGDVALAYARRTGQSLFLGLQNTQKAVTELQVADSSPSLPVYRFERHGHGPDGLFEEED